MIATLRNSLFAIFLLMLVSLPGTSVAQKSLFENGLIFVPRIDIDGFGPLELAFSLASDGSLTLRLEQLNAASPSTPESGEFDADQLTISLYQLGLAGADDLYYLEMQVASLTPEILFEVTYAELLPPVIDSPDAPSSLTSDQQLHVGQWLESDNGLFRLQVRSDGNLVLLDTQSDTLLWSTATQSTEDAFLVLQGGDGNLVLYDNSFQPLWNTGTWDLGVNRLALNNDGSLALYADSEVVWAVNGSGQPTDSVQTGESGGDNGGGMLGQLLFSGVAGNGRFSAPSAALYALNESRQRAFPQQISTPFSGNGHAETWDGRIFVVTQEDGWYARVFRPERVGFGSDGQVNFNFGAFGPITPLELNDDAEQVMHNWIAITPDPQAGAENPYPSDEQGNYQATGSYRTYKAIVYHTSKRGADDTHVGNEQMGLRHATFIVGDANTLDAELVHGEFTSEFTRLHLQDDDSDFLCIEPSVTMDSRLVICQGHPANDGTIDNLVYSWTETPGSAYDWTAPRSLADMYYEDRNADVQGLPFFVRYALAEKPITDAYGVPYASGELVKGAYPWISHDGSELFYQASAESASGRRTGTSVVGRWTGWSIRHIDGPINRDRYDTLRLFLSSPGAFTTMWTAYKDVHNLAIPFSIRGPGYPLFGSNTNDYMEVGFDDYLDGNFVLYLGMNEQLNRAGNYQVAATSDTSGNFNNGTLVGAMFPFEYNGRDELIGRYGQGIYFPAGSYIEVDRNSNWDTLVEGFTVELFVRTLTPGTGTQTLFSLEGGVALEIGSDGTLVGRITDTANETAEVTGPVVADDQWVHVAFSHDPGSKRIALFVDGIAVAEQEAADFGTLNTIGQVQIGSGDSNSLMILDEVKVSNVARRPYEIGYSANTRYNRPPNQELVNTVPEHFRSLLSRASSVDRFSVAAAELGADLFADPILSAERTTSCSTCHAAALAFTDGRSIAQGNEPTDAGTRNSPMLLNRLFSSLQGWSGISASLDTQALFPIAAPHEMNLPISQAVQRLRDNQDYAARFQDVYGEPVDATNMTAALASFQAMQFTPRTRVDDFMAGDRSALTEAERRGLVLFEGKARCSGCHAGSNLTDESFRSNGLTFNADIGRAEVTGRSRDFRLFKTPSLRRVSDTAPYMHDGSIATLREVVEGYNAGAPGVDSIDTDIRPLELTAEEIEDLVAYLEAL